MDKEKLIAAIREAVIEAAYFPVDASDLDDISKACAEAALKELDNEWVRVEDRPLTKSGWIEFMTENGTYKGYYDSEFPHTIWSEQGGIQAKARVASILVYREVSPPKDK